MSLYYLILQDIFLIFSCLDIMYLSLPVSHWVYFNAFMHWKIKGIFCQALCFISLHCYFTIVKFSTVVIFWIHKYGFSDAFLNDNILNYEARFINICRVLPQFTCCSSAKKHNPIEVVLLWVISEAICIKLSLYLYWHYQTSVDFRNTLLYCRMNNPNSMQILLFYKNY